MQMMPLGVLGIGRRMQRIEAYVAKSAGDADQIGRLHLGRISAVFLYVPCSGIELRVTKSAHPDDARRLARNIGNPWNVGTGAVIQPQPVLVGMCRLRAVRIVNHAEE